MALRYTPEQLTKKMIELDFTTFEDGGLEGPWRLVEHYGWYAGNAFHSWIEQQIAHKLRSKKATFKQLEDAMRIDLRIVAADVSTQLAEVYSAATQPELAVADAVRRSMSIPFFFAAVQDAKQVFVDGGTIWNYPIEIFDGADPNPQTLGFHLDPTTNPPPIDVHDLVSFVKALYESLLAVQGDFFQRNVADVARTVRIDDLGIRATDFAITTKQKHALIESGASATRDYLAAYGVPPPAAS